MNLVVSLIGRSNVGKSSLFNVLMKKKYVLVDCKRGTTKDRNYGFLKIKNSNFTIIDTAGIDLVPFRFFKKQLDNINLQNSLKNQMFYQTLFALKKSDLILFIVDAFSGIHKIDFDILKIIRFYEKNVFLVINKIDKVTKNYSSMLDFFQLGISKIFEVSLLHNNGVKKILNELTNYFHKNLFEKKDNISDKNITILENFFTKKKDNFLKISFIGKPNVGKSTFINSLVKENRTITDSLAGTTKGNTYIPYIWEDKNYLLIDTGGINRKKKKQDFIDYVSMLKTIHVIRDSQITVIVFDASSGICMQDLSLLNVVYKKSRAFVIIVNKWDLITENLQKKKFKYTIKQRLNFIKNYNIYYVSALKKINIKNFFSKINKIYLNSIRNFSPTELTKIINQAVLKHPIPSSKNNSLVVRLKYAHLGGRNPFVIVIHGNRTNFLSHSYKKYIKNYLQKILNIKETPVHLLFKNNNNPFFKKN